MAKGERKKKSNGGNEAHGEAAGGPTIVGIGASAGGLSALRGLFSSLKKPTGVAWVVVVHLSPEHPSHLTELLQPHCPLPIAQVTETTALEVDRVYVIPPGANLSTIDTHLRLSELEAERRHRAPIDHFFRTLAATHDGNAVGVILTGTGTDGTLGLRRIKEQGGLTVAQDPEEAEHGGMPRSAISSGMVDLVLPLKQIGPEVVRSARTRPRLDGLAEVGVEIDAGDEARVLQKILAQVRGRTGHDFSQYKRSTVLRRIQRRMQLRHVETLGAYLEELRSQRDEAVNLFNDLLITVTEFFRDREVYERLEREVIPKLFEGKGPEDRVRVWSVGCSTGEEAYSLAMLLMEEAGRREDHPQLQVFASDLHERALAHAREGIYPGEIAGDVSPERLKRFFVKEDEHYRVRREVRELVVFAPHNMLRDPPFSRLDLIVCRNLLIYLQRDVQQDVAAIFHYALNENGMLLLGSSETVERRELFDCIEKDLCLYRRRHAPSHAPRLPAFPMSIGARFQIAGEREARERGDRHETYGAIHERMAERYGPPSVLVNSDYEVVHSSASAGRYLQLPGGEPTRQLFKLALPALRIELRSVLHEAREKRMPARSHPQTVEVGGEKRWVVLRAHPATDPELAGFFFLVMFDEVEEAAEDEAPPEGESGRSATTVRELEAELELNRQRLQSVIEEYETSREEMQASNEELQSANEELRSTMEELETSKEELQSMNEELATLNQENRHRVEELGQLSTDLNNLLSATDIATIFLDRDLRIVRFTPKVGDIFNIRLTDRGRPLSDLTHHLSYGDMQEDAQRVLARLSPVEREVAGENGSWYLARLLPYRSDDDRIEGVVVNFIDISERKRAEEEVHEAKEYAESIVETLHEPLLVLDPKLNVKSANQAFYEHFQVKREETIGRKVYALGNGQWDIPALRTLLEDVLPDSNVFNDFEVDHEFEELGRRVMLVNARRLDHVELILLGIRDVTERSGVLEALRASEERYRILVESATEYAILMTDAKGVINYWSAGARRIFGYEDAEVMGRPVAVLFTEEDRTAGVPEEELATARAQGQASDDRWQARKDGTKFWASGVTTALWENELRGYARVLRDNTENKRHEEQMRFVMAELNHRVKNTLAVVEGIAGQTLRHTGSPEEFLETFSARLRAIGKAHALLTRSDWQGVSLRQLLSAELDHCLPSPGQLRVEGPHVLIRPDAAMALHMVVHELCTNATKHGALSNSGEVNVTWELTKQRSPALLIVRWRERGGPPVKPPRRKGFGSRVLQQAVTHDLQGEVDLEYPEEGFRCTMRIPFTPEVGVRLEPSETWH